MKQFTLLLSILFIICMSGISLAQTQDTTAVSSGGDQIIDLSERATIIQVEPEKPRVNIFSDRIKPDFDDVNLERSFMSELTGTGEKVVVSAESGASDKPGYIDVDKVLQKSR